MQIVAKTHDDLVEAVLRLKREISPNSTDQLIVTFDGWECAGKTCTARKIARSLELPHLDLDKFLIPDRGTILNHVRYDDLASELESHSQTVLFSGACMREVLNRIGLNVPILTVYVKRMSAEMWADSHLIYPEGEMTVEEFWATGSFSPLTREMAEYHHEFQPDRTSDICFLRR